jgi:hypothetical protein
MSLPLHLAMSDADAERVGRAREEIVAIGPKWLRSGGVSRIGRFVPLSSGFPFT